MKSIMEDEYYSLVESKMPFLALFGAEWCNPCQQVTAELEKMEEDYEGEIPFVKVDIEDCPNVTSDLGIRSVPTLVYFEKGEPSEYLFGFQSRKAIEAMLSFAF